MASLSEKSTEASRGCRMLRLDFPHCASSALWRMQRLVEGIWGVGFGDRTWEWKMGLLWG